ncbi:MAG: ATP-binding protein [Lachnospiraceae bacterium]|nr:ATP-binding protein [Lachnospiraceae bacterium]
MRENELIVYKHFDKDDAKLLYGMINVAEHFCEMESEEAKALFYDCVNGLIDLAGSHGFYGNIWHCFLTNLLVNNENTYSKACEITGSVEGSINEAVLHDIKIFKEFFELDFAPLTEFLGTDCFSIVQNYISSAPESKVYNSRVRERICNLAKVLSGNSTALDMKETLTAFYKDYGVGKFGLHKAFRLVHNADDNMVSIEPILNITHVKLDDLVGYEIPKSKLIENTEAFVNGKRANNCLLYGDSGTGKSSSIKAIANTYYEHGLRIIEIYKHDFRYINDVISEVKNRNYKFILYMDDLSFEEFETEYKYLKAVIEGGLEKKPKNVLIYATSNRRHLVREKFSDKAERDDDLHTNDTVQEKLSLSQRFGVSIYFGSPDKKEFEKIVLTLAERNGLDIPKDELLLLANKWELSHGGRSGRTASQFIDNLVGSKEI